VTDVNPSPVEPSKSTDRPASESPDSEKDQGADGVKVPTSLTQKRKMTEALDDFLEAN
jgi:hypothetical protein